MLQVMSSDVPSNFERTSEQDDNRRSTTGIQKGSNASSSSRRGRRRSSNSTLPCPTCGELYSRRDNLRVHQRVHSGEKPFKCEVCGARFRWIGVLRTHEATHRRRGETNSSNQSGHPPSATTVTPPLPTAPLATVRDSMLSTRQTTSQNIQRSSGYSLSQRQPSQDITINMLLSDENEDYSDNRNRR